MMPAASFASRRGGLLFLFAPDFCWIAVITGSLAATWIVPHTWLTL